MNLHIISGLGQGGAENMLVKVLQKKQPYKTAVITLGDDGYYGSKIRAMGYKLYTLNIQTEGFLKALFCLVKIIKKHQPQNIMTWLYHADFMGLLATMLAGQSPKKVIWNVRCSYLNKHDFTRSMRILMVLLPLLSRLPGVVAFNSYAGKKNHKKQGYKPKQWLYLPNGFDEKTWYPDEHDKRKVRQALNIPENAHVFGTMARVHPQKDHETLIKAIAIVQKTHDFYFIFAGHGTQMLSIPHHNAICLGKRDDIPFIMRALDVHILSSAYGEGFPNVVGEAMLTAIPNIATDVGDSRHLIGETGWIVPQRYPKSLADAMIKAINSSDLSQKGQKAREIILKNYTLKSIQNNYTKLLK